MAKIPWCCPSQIQINIECPNSCSEATHYINCYIFVMGPKLSNNALYWEIFLLFKYLPSKAMILTWLIAVFWWRSIYHLLIYRAVQNTRWYLIYFMGHLNIYAWFWEEIRGIVKYNENWEIVLFFWDGTMEHNQNVHTLNKCFKKCYS